jgi:hypothetical protein
MSFGVATDYFGLASDDWELQSSGLAPEASNAQAKNEFGDVIKQDEYEQTETVECVYKLKSNGTDGSISLPANFKGGYKSGNYIITGGSLNTSNSERPILTVTGEKFFGPTEDHLRVYDFATAIGAILARKVATAIGFELGANTYLNGSSVSCSCETSRTLGADGAIVVIDIFNGRLEASGDLISATASPSATAATDWTLSKGNDVSEGNTDHGSGTVNVYRNLAAEA